MSESNGQGRRKILRNVSLGLGAVGVVGSGFVAGKLFGHRSREQKLNLTADIPGFFWPDPPALPEFSLVDHKGRPFTRTNLLDRWSMLYFGYTSCPDACPIALGVLAQVEMALGRHQDLARRFQGVFISVDPERDRDKLGVYVGHFSERFVGATADDKSLLGITRPLGIIYLRQSPDGNGEYLVDHSNSLLLIDPEARLVGLFNGPHDASHIATTLEKIHSVVVRVGADSTHAS